MNLNGSWKGGMSLERRKESFLNENSPSHGFFEDKRSEFLVYTVKQQDITMSNLFLTHCK